MFSHSPNKTAKIASDFASRLKKGSVLALTGNLGSGKTHFTKGLAQYFKIKKNITSPTFVLMKVYKVRNKRQETRDKKIQKYLPLNKGESAGAKRRLEGVENKIKTLVHVDCYRLNDPVELLAIGLGEYLNNPACLVVIEWAEKIKKILPKNSIWIKFSLGQKENERKIEIKK
jgi:tRNA threonylcarbamoyladenosine biosynthesis protein TsaE